MTRLTKTKPSKPLLIYDGDCGFCQYSINYWQQLTHDAVTYLPYQAVASEYPEISADEFKAAIQYISPQGEVASAAKAGFLTLDHSANSKLWLVLYNYLPGFAFFAECAYRLVSTHRNFFYRLCMLFWGKQPRPPQYDLLAWLFLRLFGVIALIVFISFLREAQALIGSDGILPISHYLNAIYQNIGARGYWLLPNIFWLNASDTAIQVVCWAGIVAAGSLILNIFPRLSLLCIYVLYLSLIYAGQVFMTFQWDMLLVEVSIIAFFLVRFRVLGIWLLRWLTFRFVLLAGIVKIASGDTAWWDLTALNYHFLTQPLPTPLAWYVYYFPEWILKILTGMSLFIELVVPFFIFAPRRLRIFAAFSILGMQAGIMLTGNYNFFNITTVLICLSLFDDAALATIIPTRLVKYLTQKPLASKPSYFMKLLAIFYTVIAITISIAQFNMRFVGAAPIFTSWLNSTVDQYQLVNTYGPFAVMTKKRYEIIVEGSNDGVTWKEYQFKYKPGNVKRAPRWNIPMQPRLDWQMWFAALGSVQNNPWFIMFMQRLLENSPSVTALLADNPFPDYPPVFVRALFYDYRYTTEAEYLQTHAWWERELVGMYLPSVSLK